MKRKLKSQKGETLIETLAALLVMALGTAVFAGMVNVSSRMNESAIERDRSYYAALTRAETVAGGEAASVTVTYEDEKTDTVSVTLSRADDSKLVSYRIPGGAPS